MADKKNSFTLQQGETFVFAVKTKDSFNNGLNKDHTWLNSGIATMSFTKDGKPQLIVNQAFAPRMRPDKADESLIKPEPLFLFPLEERVVNNGEADEKSKTA
jgi:hypothetical protein